MIIIVGVAGSGKSTQSRLLADYTGWHWISVGQLLRDATTGELREEMLKGKLLEDQAVYKVLIQKLETIPKGEIVVVDGFPRKFVQGQWLLDTVLARGDVIEAVIHLQAHEEVVYERLLSRGRIDDQPEAIKQRFLEYEHEIKPLLNLMKQKNVNIIDVNGEQDPSNVQENIRKALRDVGVIHSND